jgi:hypothetical protein
MRACGLQVMKKRTGKDFLPIVVVSSTQVFVSKEVFYNSIFVIVELILNIRCSQQICFNDTTQENMMIIVSRVWFQKDREYLKAKLSMMQLVT